MTHEARLIEMVSIADQICAVDAGLCIFTVMKDLRLHTRELGPKTNTGLREAGIIGEMNNTGRNLNRVRVRLLVSEAFERGTRFDTVFQNNAGKPASTNMAFENRELHALTNYEAYTLKGIRRGSIEHEMHRLLQTLRHLDEQRLPCPRQSCTKSSNRQIFGTAERRQILFRSNAHAFRQFWNASADFNNRRIH